MRLESHLASGSRPREAVDLSGRWRNQHGSEMQIRVGPGGRLAGSYHTAVGAPSPKQEFELVGFACGDLVVFTVDFGRFGSLTAWTGQHSAADGVERIHTLWHLAKTLPQEDDARSLYCLTGYGSTRRQPLQRFPVLLTTRDLRRNSGHAPRRDIYRLSLQVSTSSRARN